MILTSLSRYRELGLLILRLGLGFMFVLHGWPKLMGGPEKWVQLGKAVGAVGLHFSEPLQFMTSVFGFLAAFAESGGGVLMMIGFFFRPATILIFITMLVATAMHWNNGDDFMAKTSRPLELAIVVGSLILIGPGKYSVDKN